MGKPGRANLCHPYALSLIHILEAAREHIDFSEEIWADIHEAQKKYFENQEVVGWFFAQPECPVAATEVFTKAHVKNFGGEKVLMLMEPVEREDGFFRYENGNLVRQRGYYIYYEKNPQMQAYMIDNNSDVQMENAEETGDDTVKNIRKIINGKKKEDGAEKSEKQEEKTSVFSYAATAVLAAAVFAVGVNFYQDYRTVKQDTGETAQVSSVIEAKTKKKKEDPKPQLTSAPAVTPVPTQKLSEAPVEEKREPLSLIHILFVEFQDFLGQSYVDNPEAKQELQEIILRQTGKMVEIQMLVANQHQHTNLSRITVDEAIRENIHMDVVTEADLESDKE